MTTLLTGETTNEGSSKSKIHQPNLFLLLFFFPLQLARVTSTLQVKHKVKKKKERKQKQNNVLSIFPVDGAAHSADYWPVSVLSALHNAPPGIQHLTHNINTAGLQKKKHMEPETRLPFQVSVDGGLSCFKTCVCDFICWSTNWKNHPFFYGAK